MHICKDYLDSRYVKCFVFEKKSLKKVILAEPPQTVRFRHRISVAHRTIAFFVWALIMLKSEGSWDWRGLTCALRHGFTSLIREGLVGVGVGECECECVSECECECVCVSACVSVYV